MRRRRGRKKVELSNRHNRRRKEAFLSFPAAYSPDLVLLMLLLRQLPPTLPIMLSPHPPPPPSSSHSLLHFISQAQATVKTQFLETRLSHGFFLGGGETLSHLAFRGSKKTSSLWASFSFSSLSAGCLKPKIACTMY